MSFDYGYFQNFKPNFGNLQLANKHDEIVILNNWISQISTDLDMSSRDKFRINLVLEEIVTNIIDNAYEDDAEHQIAISVSKEEGNFRILVKDDGLPFDPLQHPNKALPKSLADAQIGGLGIHLFRNYTDECHYRREDNSNVLTLLFHSSE